MCYSGGMNQNHKVCDMDMALRRMGRNAELLREVIEMVRADLPEILNRLRAALAAGDSTLVQREAHSLKGALVTFDAQAALSATQRLEQFANAGDLSQAAAMIEGVAREVALLDAALAAELIKAPPVT